MYFEINLKNSTLAATINCDVKKEEFCNIFFIFKCSRSKLSNGNVPSN